MLEVIFPLRAFALTGGPTQPEVQGFEPIGTSEMVDPFTGDFKYNIPLMDIDGYPINISYSSSNVTMDQEASWVGLGWSLNPGSIIRGMRGIPDDFCGEVVERKISMRDNITHGFNAGINVQLFGIPSNSSGVGLNLSLSAGIKYNNYTGISLEKTVGASVSFSSGKNAAGKQSGSLGLNITSSSENGLSINQSTNFNFMLSSNDRKSTSLGTSLGCGYNSRAGLQYASFGVNIQHAVADHNPAGKDDGKNTVDADYSKGVGGSFNFGMPTYTPQINYPMKTTSATINFTLGAEVYGAHPNTNVKYYYSRQKLIDNTIATPAYGYMNSDKGQTEENVMLDFNREKDGAYTLNAVALPLTNFTYDIYSVSGQGVGGSYRPFRSDVGFVFDSKGYSVSESWSTGGEIGSGNLFHGGLDVNVTNVNSTSGKWSDENNASEKFKYRSAANYPTYEKWYFKEANEKSVNSDTAFYNNMAKNKAVRLKLKENAKYSVTLDNMLTDGVNNYSVSSVNYRSSRDKRNSTITYLTRKEVDNNLGLQGTNDLHLIENPTVNGIAIRDHHIAEITALNTDGSRYVYGIAAYNILQHETTFSVEGLGDPNTGNVTYTDTENSLDNKSGQDHYYSDTKMPAYAHSYLLTAVLSPDYIDSDGDRGPTDGDIGNYTKFSYEKINKYCWRTPIGNHKASFNEGFKTVNHDNKASYVYGEKELWYLNKIETKNFIAIFTLEDRKDGYGVIDQNGDLGDVTTKLLRKITLYSKKDFQDNGEANAIPIKTVHFVYDYSLCPGVNNFKTNDNDPNKGKLTLRRIYFTYGKSQKAQLSPYVFNYKGFNPPYAPKNVDRWGNYKAQPANAGFDFVEELPNSEYPYVEQDTTTANLYAKAWLLDEIKLPSGGIINIDYEADDYAYVQNVPAMQMYKIGEFTNDEIQSMGLNDNNNISNNIDKFRFKLSLDENGTPIRDVNKYIVGVNQMYFRCLMRMKPLDYTGYEYVSGYAEIESVTIEPGDNYGTIIFKEVKLKESESEEYCPIIKAATQFGRLNLSKEVWKTGLDISDNDNVTIATVKTLFSLISLNDFVTNISEALKGPNKALFDKNIGKSMISNKSWIRMNNVTGHKYGGGTRVKRILINDGWGGMTDNDGNSFSRGQEYSYNNVDGTSSGVATYEPQIGGDENSLKNPIPLPNDEGQAFLAPDDDHYVETPFGESFYPSPSVGYGRVEIKNIYKDQNSVIKSNSSGSVVHEFYTAKDYPTITSRTSIDKIRHKSDPVSLRSIFNIDVKDNSTVSQGYVIELNDMHGKPKSQSVYQEGSSTPISSIMYRYKSTGYASSNPNIYNGSKRLVNDATVIYSNGNVNTASIGLFSDMVTDMRQDYTKIESSGVDLNVDVFLIGIFPVPVFVPIPTYSCESTQFRSAVVTKVIQRFGILEETIASDLGSVVSTKNLAYDAESGEVLVTQTTTNFDDNIYSITFPAYWYYNGMGAAYKNIGFTMSGLNFTDGYANIANATSYFAEGDELSVIGSNTTKAWVTEVTQGRIKAMDYAGNNIEASGATIKIIRSGRKNQQSLPMQNITMYENPLNGIKSNFYDKVVQASAIEYSNQWKTFCDCFENNSIRQGLNSQSSNPFIMGTKGMYKPNKSFLHLSGRTQENYNNNTNIRRDGVFTSFSSFYKLKSGKWITDPQNWTFTSEVTQFSPFGAELENMDALGRFSAATFGYNQSLAVGVAANTQYKELGVDNFEDYGFNGCADKHFKFNALDKINDNYAHTGRKSVKVTSSSPVVLSKTLVSECNCNITSTKTEHKNFIQAHYTGGKTPYTYSWTTTNNDLNIRLGLDGFSILIERILSQSYNVEIIVRDRYGCEFTETVHIVDGHLSNN